MDIKSLLKDDVFFFEKGRQNITLDALQKIEQVYALQLPADYVTLMLNEGNFSLQAESSAIYFLTPEEILEKIDRAYRSTFDIGFAFASDGGGSFFYYDSGNQLGKGHNAIYLFDRGYIKREGFDYVAANMSELLQFVVRENED